MKWKIEAKVERVLAMNREIKHKDKAKLTFSYLFLFPWVIGSGRYVINGWDVWFSRRSQEGEVIEIMMFFNTGEKIPGITGTKVVTIQFRYDERTGVVTEQSDA